MKQRKDRGATGPVKPRKIRASQRTKKSRIGSGKRALPEGLGDGKDRCQHVLLSLSQCSRIAQDDGALDFVGFETERHRPAHTRKDSDVVKLSDQTLDANPVDHVASAKVNDE